MNDKKMYKYWVIFFIYFPTFTKIKKMKFLIINGPNLNLLGIREQDIYGTSSFEDYFKELQNQFPNYVLEYFQSNIEGELVAKLQEAGFSYNGIILNAGAYTHTSIALYDVIKTITTPVIEVHISNTFSRESFRHISYVSPVAKGIIIGFGLHGYKLALQSLL